MTTEPDGAPPATPEQLSDPELITAVRAGDPDAFGTLYTRHVQAARRLALALARHPSDADDLVAEAFAKLLGALRDGGGPNVAFRAYLLTTVRNLHHDRTRKDSRLRITDDLSTHDAGVPFVDTAVEGLERTLVARAFSKLPERWQAVLWHTEVEGETPATVAPMLDLSPNGVATLAYRARERLRQNYLREHVSSSPTDACRETIDRLGAYVRSGLSHRDRGVVDDHLAGCRRCQVLFLELGDLNTGLRGLLAPAVLGTAAAAGYLGALPASGFTGFIAPIWSTTKRLSRRRSTQVGAAGAVVAAAVALALVLTSGPPAGPDGDPPPPSGPGAAGPDPPVPGEPPPDQPGRPESGTGAPTAGTSGAAGESPAPGGSPAAPDDPAAPGDPVTTQVSLEAVGALVPDRPGVLALTVAAPEPAGGTGGSFPAGRSAGRAPGTGPLTAVITVPDGVALRPGEPGGGWRCAGAAGGIRCERASLPVGTTTRAFLPVTVAPTTGDGAPRVRLTGPGIASVTATAARGVRTDGLAARLAGIMPATVVAGGGSLLSCLSLDLTCGSARTGGGGFGRTDNDDYFMTSYRSRRAPPGAPRRAMVSGARIRLPGEVVWAGLYWAGSGRPPDTPTAHLHTPGRGGYTAVPATTVRRVGGDQLRRPAYQASAEVTELVRGATGDDWWVAVEAGAFDNGIGSFGGWALLVVAEDGGPDRSVAVFDELTPLPEHGSFSAEVYGGPGESTIGFVGWEGDRGLTGDRLRIGGATLDGGGGAVASRADGTPDGWNTFGTDARVHGSAVSGAGRPGLTATGGGDAWLLGPVVMVTPTTPPLG